MNGESPEVGYIEPTAVSLFARVVEVCDRFEDEFRRGNAPRIEDHLGDSTDSLRPALIRELIALELELRRGRGERPEPEEYRGRFPDDDAIDRAFQIEPDQAASTEHALAEPHPKRPADRPGHRPTIAGFEIFEELGRGAMGVVYKAKKSRLNRLCALKMILSADLAGPEAGLRFLTEAEAVARLQHQGVVQIYGIGDHEGHPYLELEYVAGGTLARAIGGAPRSARDAAKLVQAIALAVGEAHRLGIVHRDLKPGNVLLTLDGRPKVADFGLAKSLDHDGDDLTRTGSVLGSPSYMAPEQAQGRTRDAGPAADIYSLGAIFYELITGRPPFRAPTILQTLEQVKNADPVPPSRLQPGLSRDAETICLTCLQKDPARRYPTAEALADDLRRFLGREPIRARRVSTAEVAWRWCRRRPAIAGLLTALILSNSVGAVLLARMLGQQAIILGDIGNERKAASLSASEARKEHRKVLIESAKFALEHGVKDCEDGEIGRGLVWMARSLDAAPADLVEFRWAVRAKMAHWRLGMATLERAIEQPAEVSIARYSPDGSRIVTGTGLYYSNQPHTAQILDAATGEPVTPPLPHGMAVLDAVFSPDGQVVYTFSYDQLTRAWDAKTGQLRNVVAGMARQTIRGEDLALSPDGQSIVISSGNFAQIRKTETGELVGQRMTHRESLLDLEWSPDGKLIASACKDGTVSLHDGATGALVRTMPVPGGSYIYSATFSPDGLRLIAAGSSHTYHLFDVATGKLLAAPAATPHRGVVYASTFHPSGRFVATAGMDGDVRLTDLASGRPISQPMPHGSCLWSVSFDPKGRTILTSGEDKTVRIFSMPQGYALARSIPHGHAFTTATFRPEDGREILTGSGDGIARRWDSGDGLSIGPNSRARWKISRARYDPEGRAILTVGGFTARLWEPDTGRPLPGSAPLFHHANGHHMGIVSTAFTPDGRTILTGNSDKTVRRWEASTGRLLGILLRTNDAPRALACSPDGREIVTGDWSGHIQRWDLATGKPIGPQIQHGNKATDLAYSPSGKLLLTGSENGSAQLWRLNTMKRVGPAMKHAKGIHRAMFSPDGRMIATASEDATVRLWDTETSTPLGPPIRVGSSVVDLNFRPDGKALLAVTLNGSIRGWDLPELPTDHPDRLKAWSQLASGLEVDEVDEVDAGVEFRPLDGPGWRRISARLTALGGSPFPGPDAPRDEPTRDLWRGIDAAQAGDLFAARWHLDQYLGTPSHGGRGDFSILLGLGDAFQARSDPASALKVFREAVRQRPDSADTRFHLGLALTNGTDNLEARAELLEIRRLHADDPEALLLVANGLTRLGDRTGTIEVLRAALAIRPDLVPARIRLTWALMPGLSSRDLLPASVRLLSIVNPRQELWLKGLEVFEAHGWFEPLSVELLDVVCRRFPRSSHARVLLGRALSRSSRSDRAVAAFEEAIRLDANCAWGHLGLASEFMEAESAAVESPKSLERQLRALSLREPGNLAAWINLGTLLQSQGDSVGASRAFREGIRLRPDDRYASASLAEALESLGDFAGALAEYDRAAATISGDAEVFNSRAWFLATCPDPKFRDGNRAVVDAKKAVALAGFDDPDHLDTLAAALAEPRNFTEAIQYQARVVELDSRQEFRDRLADYKKSVSYHDPAPTRRR